MDAKHPLLYFSVFTVVCLAFSAWIVATIGNISPFADREGYEAEFADVTGLIVNDAVKVSGVTVGKVTGIEVLPGGTALVRFELDDDLPITDEAVVTVRWRDVFGLRFLYVAPGDGQPVEPGHRFPLAHTRSPTDLGVLLQRIVPFMRALSPEIQNEVLQALSEGLLGNTEEVRGIISRGADLTQALASREQEIERLLDNSATVLEAYAAREQELREFLDSFAEVADTVAARNDTLEDAVTTIASAQGELADRLEATDEDIRGILDALDAITMVLSVNHDNLEDIVEFTGRGVVGYHLISRVGQWFNVRAVGGSSDYCTLASDRDAQLPDLRGKDPDCPASEDSGGSGMAGFFGAGSPALGGGVR